ncbi:unnamed protein product, partial [Pleuronectes platessa]
MTDNGRECLPSERLNLINGRGDISPVTRPFLQPPPTPNQNHLPLLITPPCPSPCLPLRPPVSLLPSSPASPVTSGSTSAAFIGRPQFQSYYNSSASSINVGVQAEKMGKDISPLMRLESGQSLSLSSESL